MLDKYTRIVYYILVRRYTYMKRRDLIKRLEAAGFRKVRDGANHDIYKRGNEEEPIPRHREINENLAKAIIRRRGL